MKRIITVAEFCEQFLEPTQTVWVLDFDTDYPYFVGRVSEMTGEQAEFQTGDKMVFSARIQCIREHASITNYKNGIALYI